MTAGRTLVVGPAWIGDMVVADALFRLLADRERGPVDVVAPGWSLPLTERMPEVRRGWRLAAGHGQLGLDARRRLARELRREGFSQAIVLPRSFKAAFGAVARPHSPRVVEAVDLLGAASVAVSIAHHRSLR